MERRIYNLDALRFFAALIVLLTHIEAIKSAFELPSYFSLRFFTNSAATAVTFFFVLSGFLITYLLIEEESKTEKSKWQRLSHFYKKRVARIWPLYFLLLIMVFFILPDISFFQTADFNAAIFPNKNCILYFAFCPNLYEYFFGKLVYLDQLWSIGVEEFFYLFFPVGLIFLFSGHRQKFFLVLFLISSILYLLDVFHLFHLNDLEIFSMYIQRYRIFAFAGGAMAGSLFIKYKDDRMFVFHKRKLKITAQILLIVSLLLVVFGVTIGGFTQLVYVVIFSALLFLNAVTEIRFTLLNNTSVIYCGRISYGIYMLHRIVIVFFAREFLIRTQFNLLNSLLFDLLVVAATILLAAVSYNFFEKPFIKMATR